VQPPAGASSYSFGVWWVDVLYFNGRSEEGAQEGERE